MKLQGAIGLQGIIHLLHWRGDNLLEDILIYNTITNMGIDQVSGLVNGTRTGAFTKIGIGTSGSAAAASNTGLLAEITSGSLNRASATTSQITTDTTNDTARLLHTFSATATYSIKECGIFNSASGGRILGRKTFAVKSMVSGDSLQITYDIDID